jgi:exonuclease VII large subunit
MFKDDTILQQVLEQEIEDAKQQIRKTKTISTQNAILLMLEYQSNHIDHMEKIMATKDDLKSLEKRLEEKIDSSIKPLEDKVDSNIKKTESLEKMIKDNRFWIMYSTGILALVFTLLTLFVK